MPQDKTKKSHKIHSNNNCLLKNKNKWKIKDQRWNKYNQKSFIMIGDKFTLSANLYQEKEGMTSFN